MGSQPAHSCTLGIPQMTSFFNLLFSSVLGMTFIQSITCSFTPCIHSLSMPYLFISLYFGPVPRSREQHNSGWKAAEHPRLKSYPATPELLGAEKSCWKPLPGEGCASRRQRPWLLNESLSGAVFGSQSAPRRRSSIAQHPQLLEVGFQLSIRRTFRFSLGAWPNRPFTRILLLAYVTCQGTADLQNVRKYSPSV